jgi:murein DD-endopeptidase MepM/ murein hydrolase activator NlpD
MRFSPRLLGTLGLLALGAGCAPVYSESVHGGESVRATDPDRTSGAARSESGETALVRALESLVWPLAADGSALLTSPYGDRIHPASGDPRFHTGLDLRAREGTAVYAAADGRVVESGRSSAYGNVVVLEHGGGLRTLYAHHQRNLVRVGDFVRRGQPIAQVGHTGNATGDHLHFEVRWKGGTVDPRIVLPRLSTTTAR